MQDHNFNDTAEKFPCNIRGITRGQLQRTILWQDLDHVLAEVGPQKLRVLDASGEGGQTAVKMAERGHQVVLCDLSAQMIDRAKQVAGAKGASDNVRFIRCAAQDATSRLKTSVDLILSHTVLGQVVDSRSVLQTLWSVLHPSEVLLLMFYNAHGLLMHNMVTKNFDCVQVGMPKGKKRTLLPDYPRDSVRVYLRLKEAGWQIMGKTGVRVLRDYLYEKHQQYDCYEALLKLETRYCRQRPYITLGCYIHVTAREPQGKDKVRANFPRQSPNQLLGPEKTTSPSRCRQADSPFCWRLPR